MFSRRSSSRNSAARAGRGNTRPAKAFITLVAILPMAAFLISATPVDKKLGWDKIPAQEAATVSSEIDKRHERGRAIYNYFCYFCHGYSGDARTLAATYLSPKPRNFIETTPQKLSRARMIESVKKGVSGTAMARFEGELEEDEIEAVVDFVRREFMLEKAKNTWYHTPENGWANHERYSAAFPFAKGEIPLDSPDETLTEEQKEGRRLFMKSCISCHDRAHVSDEGPVWRKMKGLTKKERLGETLYQKNCAFCHAKDGTAENWFGAFLRPHPRNLTSDAMDEMTRSKLRSTIENGLPGTSMSAWKSVLSSDEIDAIIAYISKAFHSIPDDAAPGWRTARRNKPAGR